MSSIVRFCPYLLLIRRITKPKRRPTTGITIAARAFKKLKRLILSIVIILARLKVR